MAHQECAITKASHVPLMLLVPPHVCLVIGALLQYALLLCHQAWAHPSPDLAMAHIPECAIRVAHLVMAHLSNMRYCHVIRPGPTPSPDLAMAHIPEVRH